MMFSFRLRARRGSPAAELPSEKLPVGEIRHFPVRNAVGLDISDATAEAVAVTRGKSGQYELVAFNRVELPEGIVRAGEVLNADALATALRELFAGARPAKFSSPFVVLSLPESKTYVRTFEYPPSFSDSQVRSALRYDAEGVLPLPLESVYFDAATHRSRQSHNHVLLAAVPQRVADAYVRVLEAAGLIPVALDIEAEALARSLVGYRDESVIVADLGATITTVSMVERGAVHGAVSVEIAGRNFTALFAEAAGIPLAEAESRKQAEGMTEQAPPKARRALEGAAEKIASEIRRMAAARESHTGRKIAEVVLAGGSAQLPGLAEFLQARASLQVRVGDPLAILRVALPSALSPADRDWLQSVRTLFATGIGLAARGVARDPVIAGVNLLPNHRKRKYLYWRENLALSIFSGATTAILLGFLILFVGRAGQLLLRNRGGTEARSADILAQFGPRVREALETAKAVNAEVDALAQFERQRGDVLGVFEKIRAAFSEGARVQFLNVASASGQKPTTVKLRGVADTRDRFLAFEERLKRLEGLQALDSPLSNLDQPQGGGFTVTLTFDPAP